MGERLLGVDGCPGGWVGVWEDLTTGRFGAELFQTTQSLFADDWNMMAIDIPIGLPEAGSRQADIEARMFLGRGRKSSVFPAPVRAAVTALDYETACTITQRIDGRRVSRQAFAIFRRIAEVDEEVRSIRRPVFEIHPEVSFVAMNGLTPLAAAKRSPLGKQERQALLSIEFGASLFQTLRHQFRRSVCADDDLADAMAALWSARRLRESRAVSLPKDPTTDSLGVRTAIWY